MEIEALAFDLDGTLYPSREMYLHSLPFLLRHPRLVSHFNRVRKAIRTIRPIHDFRQLQAELFARSFGITPEKAAELIERDIYGEWEHSFRGVRTYPGVRQALDDFRRTGLKLAVASDLPVENASSNSFGLTDCGTASFRPKRPAT